jgi:hypothetical protein
VQGSSPSLWCPRPLVSSATATAFGEAQRSCSFRFRRIFTGSPLSKAGRRLDCLNRLFDLTNKNLKRRFSTFLCPTALSLQRSSRALVSWFLHCPLCPKSSNPTMAPAQVASPSHNSFEGASLLCATSLTCCLVVILLSHLLLSLPSMPTLSRPPPVAHLSCPLDPSALPFLSLPCFVEGQSLSAHLPKYGSNPPTSSAPFSWLHACPGPLTFTFQLR